MRLPADRVERASLVAGVALAVASLAVLAALWRADPVVGRGLALQWTAHLAIGKETGIPVGLAAGVPPALAALAAFAQDGVTLLLGYPLAMAAGRGTLRIAWLERLVHRPHPARDRFAARTEIAGVAILAASLWVPFLPSGALVASLAGRAAGYRMRLLLPVLAASALASSVVYAWLFSSAIAAAGDARTPLALAAAAAVAALAVGWIARRK